MSPETEESKLRDELAHQKRVVARLASVLIRGMVMMKYLIRAGSLVACWYWLGHSEAYWLAGLLALVGLLQLTIDKARQIINPDLHLSEWNVL